MAKRSVKKGGFYHQGKDVWGDTRSEQGKKDGAAIKKAEEDAKRRNDGKHGALYDDSY